MIKILVVTFLIIIIILHFYFLILEMFLWTRPKTRKAFGTKDEAFAKETKVLAANQGLYNGFLAAGLLFFSFIEKHIVALQFFLICIIVAGIYGAYSTGKIKLFIIQSVPAIICFILIRILIRTI